MSNSSRSYSKPEPVREPKALLQDDQVVEAIELQTGEISMVDDSYQKQEGILPVKTFWVIISGGQKREKDYFKIISQQDLFKRIKLEYIADPNKLNPKGMLEKANYLHERFESSVNEESALDKIFLIADVDHFLNELIEIKPICTEAGYKLIISNSCFEVWLYYAFSDKVPDMIIPENPLKISSKFKGWANDAVRGGLKPTQAIFKIYENIDNARKNYQENENGIPMLFSTNMFELAEELTPLIEPELTNLIKENEKRKARLNVRK